MHKDVVKLDAKFGEDCMKDIVFRCEILYLMQKYIVWCI